METVSQQQLPKSCGRKKQESAKPTMKSERKWASALLPFSVTLKASVRFRLMY